MYREQRSEAGGEQANIFKLEEAGSPTDGHGQRNTQHSGTTPPTSESFWLKRAKQQQASRSTR